MNIRIDVTSLLLPGAGVRTYLHYWLLSLLEACPDENISTYPPLAPIRSNLDHVRASDQALRLLVVLCSLRGNPLLRLMLMGADVFHASQHMTKMPRRKCVTATAFDFSCWTTPQHHTAANIAATRRYAEKILKACDGIIAISSHARDDAMAILGLPEKRIRVIYPGVSEAFFRVTPEAGTTIRGKYGLDSPYLLFVSCIEPRKNVPMLIRAYQHLPECTRKDVQLVVAGPPGWETPEVYQMLRDTDRQIRYLGYVPELDLPGLFQGAVALSYPSQYEGFGLPVAQAMAAGVPVITSNRSSLPEVVGDAGILINPDSTEELTDAMRRLATDTELGRDLAARGRARAQLFRWPVCARRSLEFFHEVAGL